MKKSFILGLLCLIPFSLAWAEPFVSTQGPIMQRDEVENVIVVNERSIFVAPSTPITDAKGRRLEFHHLKPGRWVAIEAEPDEGGRLVAERITLIHRR